MKPHEILNCRRLPSRLNAEQVAALIGCHSHDIPPLVRAGLLKPLGIPAPNAVKWFAACEIEEKMSDSRWCTRVTSALYDHWKNRKQITQD